jgi:hypothetical protein
VNLRLNLRARLRRRLGLVVRLLDDLEARWLTLGHWCRWRPLDTLLLLMLLPVMCHSAVEVNVVRNGRWFERQSVA